MCGIAGIVSLGEARVAPGDLDVMASTITHRGPDELGSFCDGTVGLTMRRLSIIGVGNGRQPIFNEDESVAVVMNGEIYNYCELKARLIEKGHVFKTDSDVEVAVHLYEERGPAFVDELRGMFAYALYDRKQRRLCLGRDRVGKKPLYYAVHRGFVVFGSEIKALHASGLVPKEIDREGLESYLAHGFVVGDRTLFEGVRKIPAGCTLSLTGPRAELTRYWDFPTVGDGRTNGEPSEGFDAAANRVRTLLEDAVSVRLMTEVALGAFLSGGVDSSAVVAIMSRQLGRPVETFAVGFEDARIDELVHARAAAVEYGTHHHEVVIRGCSPELLHEVNWHHDEPAADPATVPTFHLSKFARQRVTVALTGEGGDELFGGYRHYRLYRKLAALEARVSGVRFAAGLLTGLEPYVGSLGPRRLWKGIWIAHLPSQDRPRGLVSVFTDGEIRRLVARDFPLSNGTGYRVAEFRRLRERVSAADFVGQAMYVDAKSQLADQLLMKVDKMSMAASLEARCPFLDQRLIDYVGQLPTEMKISRAGSKLLLRRALRGLVPDSLLDRPKQGFEVPIRDWLLGELRPVVIDALLNGNAAGTYLNTDVVRQLWQRVQARDDHHLARQLWTLVNFGVWYDQHWSRPAGTQCAR